MGTNWFREAIIYQIFVDRFSRGESEDTKPFNCKGPVFCGGNLQGVIDRLDYLKEIGINTIWLSPFNKTSAYHGYHVTDFFDVEPRFGTLDTVRELIKQAHQRGIRLLMDFVPNHMSYKHPFFLDAQKNKDSQYYRWFYFTDWPNEYLCFLHFKEIAKINLDYLPARDYIIRAAKFWLSLGIDGFRLDHVLGPSHSFWRHFRNEIKRDYPAVVLIGEIWGFRGIGRIKFGDLKTINTSNKYLKWLFRSSDSVLRAYVGELDGALDFTFQELVRDFVARKNFLRLRWLLEWKLKRHYSRFPGDFYLVSFLDNHDMNRFLFEAGQDKEKLEQAARIQFEQRNPLVIYYGTEIGLTQESDVASFNSHGDLEARRMMSWRDRDQDRGLLAFYKDLIQSRESQFGKDVR